VIVVSAVTVVVRVHLVALSSLATSPRDVAEARVWSLVTSGLLVQSPLFWSLISFALLGALTLRICGAPTLWIAAVTGHVGSTLAVYALLASARTVDGDLFQVVQRAPDYGVSAVSAAWLGAVACASWRARDRTLRGKLATMLAVVAVALFGWTLRRHLNILDLEHVIAFGIGVVVPLRVSELRRATRLTVRAASS
jgi:type IV secretory pathway VirB2 component (pilin)